MTSSGEHTTAGAETSRIQSGLTVVGGRVRYSAGESEGIGALPPFERDIVRPGPAW